VNYGQISHFLCKQLFRLTIDDEIIDIHPLIWRSKNLDNILISWNEIPEEIESQMAELEKERNRLRSDRIDRRLRAINHVLR
jgi:hypothetical protein